MTSIQKLIKKMKDIKKLKEPLLPSNFLLYARCVSSLLDEIILHYNKCLDENNTPNVTILTFFKGNISRWFNVSYLSKPRFWCTRNWWYNGKSGYLDAVKNISSQGNYKKFLFKRIIGLYSKEEEGENFIDSRKVLILGDNNNPKFIQISELIKKIYVEEDSDSKIKKYFLGNTELLKTIVPEYRDAIVNNPYIVPMGLVNKQEDQKDWINAVDFFENNFHTPDIGHPGEGVFFKYCKGVEMDNRKYNYVSMDDLFIVDIEYPNGTKGTPFGITFNQDEDTDTSGIKILQFDQIKKAREEFEEFWVSGTQKINEILK